MTSHNSTGPGAPRLHLGVDDVFAALVRADRSGGSLSDEPLFSVLAALHAEYAVEVDLYLFLQGEVDGGWCSLADLGNGVARQLAAAPWLRLGPHALDHEHPPYRQAPDDQRATFTSIYREIDRLVGPARRSRAVRLHCFSESFSLVDFWRSYGVEALLLTDRPEVAYQLPPAERRALALRGTVEHVGLRAHRTHERIEGLAAAGPDQAELAARLDGHVARHGQLVLCTHEHELPRPAVSAMARRCLGHARRRGWQPL